MGAMNTSDMTNTTKLSPTLLYRLDVDVSYSGCDEERGDELYQSQFQQAFSMGSDGFDDQRWNKVFSDLMNHIGENTLIQSILDTVAKQYGIPKKEDKLDDYYDYCMIFLFSFTHFEKFHGVLREFIAGELSETSQSYKELMYTLENVL